MIPRFRAWHKVEKKMVGAGPPYPAYPFLIDLDGTLWQSGGEAEVTPDYILMQSTGLTDRNGKEIFQGDVLENYKGERAQVVWYPKNARWSVTQGTYPKALYRWTRNTGTKVIGNIWEHPTLLPSAT